MLILLFSLIALANTSSPQNSPIDLGDRLWCQGDYKEAAQTWKEASSHAHPGIQAQSHYRRLLTASNLGWAVHGVLGDVALAECPLNDPYCALANVDRELFLSLIGLPADIQYATELSQKLLPHLPAQSTARLVWLNALPKEQLTPFAEDNTIDGMGACMLKQPKWDRGPGGAYIGFGMYGGGQLGVGASVSWTQPNIDGKMGQFQTSLAITTQYAGGLFLSYTSVGEHWMQLTGNIQRRPFYLYTDGTPEFHLVETMSLAVKPGWQWNTGQFWAGPLIRYEGKELSASTTPDWFGLGLNAGGLWKATDTLQVYFSSEYIEWQYHHLRLDSQMMWIHPSGFAALLEYSMAPNTEAPWWRIPTVGGGTVLRTAPAHRWREESLPSGVFEYRWHPNEPFGIVAFSELTYAEQGFHGGGGIGLRLRMPPQPYNTMRFDIGYGDTGWNILFGAGEFFRFGLF